MVLYIRDFHFLSQCFSILFLYFKSTYFYLSFWWLLSAILKNAFHPSTNSHTALIFWLNKPVSSLKICHNEKKNYAKEWTVCSHLKQKEKSKFVVFKTYNSEKFYTVVLVVSQRTILYKKNCQIIWWIDYQLLIIKYHLTG